MSNPIFIQRERAYEKNKNNILKLFDEEKHIKFLDLGCDDGSWTIKMANTIGTVNVFGTEIVEDAATKAKLNGVKVSIGDLNKKIPYENDMFDVVHANQVIEHLTDTDNFISEIYRVLKKGGYAIISTENLASWHNIAALMFGYMPFSLTNISSKQAALGNPFAPHAGREATRENSWQHMRIFTLKGLQELGQLHGFVPERVLTSGYYPFGSFFCRIDPAHSHFITVKFRKA